MLNQHPGTRWVSLVAIHYWPAFWTVVCLGVIQIASTYYSNVLTIDSLPSHVSAVRRRKHSRIFTSLFAFFVCLTLLLAKLNDSTQYQAELTIRAEREKQAALESELKRTLDTVTDSQMKLNQIKAAVDTHPPGPERTSMLKTLTEVQNSLKSRQSSMSAMTR